MSWTKKHDKFALSCNLSESQGYVLRDILRKGKLHEPTEVEIDLRKTNRWIGKVRPIGEYHRKTICGAIAALEEKTMGMIVILRRYNPWEYKLLVRPLSFVEKLQRAKCDSLTKPTTANPMFDGERKKAIAIQQQQNISKIDSLFKSVGVKFTNDALLRAWRLSGKSLADIRSAVELLLYRHSIGKTKISNPQGFIVDCLKYGWQKTFDLLYQPELPKFNSAVDIGKFVSGLCPT